MLTRWCLMFLLALAAACSQPPDPIAVRDNTVHVENQTPHEWRNVIVVVNDHFRGGSAKLAPGGRLTAPLSQFQTAYGQRFDFGRQRVLKIEVTATDANGAPVKLEMGGGKKQ
jgi:hypothetical protein